MTKAKAVKPIAEQMITLGRRGDIHARRQAVAFLRSKDIVHKLFDEIGPRFAERPGGYLADRQASARARRRRRDGLPRARRHAARLQDEASRTSRQRRGGGGRGASREDAAEPDEPTDWRPRPSTEEPRRKRERERRGGRRTETRRPRPSRSRRAAEAASGAEEPEPPSPPTEPGLKPSRRAWC